jgi:hypothetical protein
LRERKGPSPQGWEGEGARRKLTPILSCILLTALVATAHILTYPSYAPFHDGLDQSYYLEAARAWASLDLSPARHHYLPLYPLLGAAFVWLTPAQPFMLPDLICLLASLLIFVRIGRRLAPGWSDVALALCFLVAVASGKWMFFWLWVVPWTSTGSAPLQYLAVLLALRFGERPQPGPAAALGASIALVAGFRPSDAGVLAATTGAYTLLALTRDRATLRTYTLTTGAALAGLLAGALPWVAAHMAIFGTQGGPYIQKSAAIGFEWRLLPMRWVTLAIDPRPMLPTGNGIAEVLPWVIPGIAGMLAALIPRPGRPVAPATLAAATVSLHWALYLTYRDLNPDGLWRFVNIHYFKWTFPFLTLWAAQFAVALAQGRAARTRALAAAVLTLALFAWRPLLRKPETVDVAAVPNASGGESLRLSPGLARLNRALFLGLSGRWEDIHAGKFILHDGGAEFRSQYDFKVLPTANGALIFPLRPLPPGPALLDLPPGITRRTPPDASQYDQAITLGVPCGIFPRRHTCISPLQAKAPPL